MQATLAELAAMVDGVCTGDGQRILRGAAPLRDAEDGEIALLDSADRASQLTKTRATAAIVPWGFQTAALATIQVRDPHAAFARVVAHFRPPRSSQRRGVSPLAVVSASARLGADVEIHPYATVGDDVELGDGVTLHSGVHVMAGSRIGPGSTLFPNAVLYENTQLGARCIIHGGAVLGAYGFGYTCVDGRHRLTAQLGSVVLGDDVEIGANTTIDRGTYGATFVGEGTKIDDQVMIGHNCRLGKHNLLCSQVGIAGSTTTGDYVVMAGQAGIRDHVHIGDRAVLGAMAGIMSDVPEGARLLGIPATPEREQFIKQACFAKLPDMRKQLKALQEQVQELAARLAAAGEPADRSAA